MPARCPSCIDNLDDLDDVQNIYSNWTASDEVMAQLDEE